MVGLRLGLELRLGLTRTVSEEDPVALRSS